LVKLCKDSSDRLPAHRASPQSRKKTNAVQLSSALAAPATSSSRANCRGYLLRCGLHGLISYWPRRVALRSLFDPGAVRSLVLGEPMGICRLPRQCRVLLVIDLGRNVGRSRRNKVVSRSVKQHIWKRTSGFYGTLAFVNPMYLAFSALC